MSGVCTARTLPFTDFFFSKAANWIMCAAGVLLTTGRFFLRWQKLHRINIDDILNGVAAMFLIGLAITFHFWLPNAYQIDYFIEGTIHTPPTMSDIAYATKANVASIALFFCTIYAAKSSFLALYYQIFKPSTSFRIAWWTLVAFIFLSFWITFMSIFWRCGSPANLINPGSSSNFMRD